MTNTRTLLQALEGYHAGLVRHVDAVRQEFENLSERWRYLRTQFAGDSADEFEPYWQQTMRMFQQYCERSGAIAAILSERIKSLIEVNQRSGLLQ